MDNQSSSAPSEQIEKILSQTDVWDSEFSYIEIDQSYSARRLRHAVDSLRKRDKKDVVAAVVLPVFAAIFSFLFRGDMGVEGMIKALGVGLLTLIGTLGVIFFLHWLSAPRELDDALKGDLSAARNQLREEKGKVKRIGALALQLTQTQNARFDDAQVRAERQLYNLLTSEEKAFLVPIVERGHSVGGLTEDQHKVAQGIIDKTGWITRNGITAIYTFLNSETREVLQLVLNGQESARESKAETELAKALTQSRMEVQGLQEQLSKIKEGLGGKRQQLRDAQALVNEVTVRVIDCSIVGRSDEYVEFSLVIMNCSALPIVLLEGPNGFIGFHTRRLQGEISRTGQFKNVVQGDYKCIQVRQELTPADATVISERQGIQGRDYWFDLRNLKMIATNTRNVSGTVEYAFEGITIDSVLVRE